MKEQAFNLVDRIPQSIDLEKILLGRILLDGSIYSQVKEIISDEDFTLGHHKTLFQTFDEVYRKYSNLNMPLILDYLKSNKMLSNVGGEEILQKLTEDVISDKTAIDCAKQIKNKSARRKLLELFVKGIAKAKEDLLDTDAELDQIISKINDVNNQSVDNPYKKISQMSLEFLASLMNTPEEKLKMGFPKLDEKLDGLKKKQLITLAAETSAGKTTFAWNIALNIAMNNFPVLYLSLEMSEMEMQKKAYAFILGKSKSAVDEITLDKRNLAELTSTYETFLKEAPLFFSESSLDLNEIKRTTRLMKSKHDIKILFIDHLHFMHSKKHTESRNMEISHITWELKTLAKENNIVIFILSQLNRSRASRMDSRPVLTDLRDSGSIEQDSDVVLFLYRPGAKSKKNASNETEVIIAKNRGGERNITVPLVFDGKSSTFSEKQ